MSKIINKYIKELLGDIIINPLLLFVDIDVFIFN